MKNARFLWRSTCTTCRNARAFLRDELQVELDERDYAKTPLSAAEIAAIFKGRDPREFLNPKGQVFKARGLDLAKITAKQAIDLIAEDSRLMKRPLVIVGGQIIAGFDREQLRTALS
jgi:arsenate reductase (glutaredoxin)